MFKTLKEILRVGNATIAYPFAPLERPEYVRGKPEHSVGRCIACAACASACPPNAIQMTANPKDGVVTWSLSYGRCIFCGRCEEVCPTRAIYLTEEFELAVFDREDLERTCTYPLQACSECGTPYASAKEVSYAAAVLSGDLAAKGASAADFRSKEEVAWAIERLGMCPECKQALDAERALDAVDKAGNPTPAPSDEAVAESQRIARERKEGGRR